MKCYIVEIYGWILIEDFLPFYQPEITLTILPILSKRKEKIPEKWVSTIERMISHGFQGSDIF